MRTAKTVYFTSARNVEVRTSPLPALKDNEALVQTICSAVSAGTEMLAYRGELPQLNDAHDRISSELQYPLAYGYACIGKIVELGKSAQRKWLGKLVFSFQPHTSHFVSKIDLLQAIPKTITAENACFLANMETAVNLIQDGAPILGERVLVFGQGIVGLLTASLLSEFPLEEIITVDRLEKRREASKQIRGVKTIHPDELRAASESGNPLNIHAQNRFDLTYELSGSPSALNQAIESTMFSGRIVIGSWYGKKHSEIDLGGSFHRSRIKIISSQVSTISPELASRWDKPRRFETAWNALKKIKPEKWITHRFKIEDAAKAYQLLDERPEQTLQVIFQYA